MIFISLKYVLMTLLLLRFSLVPLLLANTSMTAFGWCFAHVWNAVAVLVSSWLCVDIIPSMTIKSRSCHSQAKITFTQCTVAAKVDDTFTQYSCGGNQSTRINNEQLLLFLNILLTDIYVSARSFILCLVASSGFLKWVGVFVNCAACVVKHLSKETLVMRRKYKASHQETQYDAEKKSVGKHRRRNWYKITESV